MLQVDLKCRVLRTESVRDVLVAKMKAARAGGDWKRDVQRELLNTSVLTRCVPTNLVVNLLHGKIFHVNNMYCLRYNNRTYKISDVDWDSNPLSTFNIEGKGEMTYVDYYKNQYGIQINDTKQPLLLSTPEKTSKSEENVLKTLALIPELCMLTGMSEAMRADFRVGPH